MKILTTFTLLALFAVAAIWGVKAAPVKNDINNDRIAVIETNKGTIKFRLYENDAPNTTGNFITLAGKKFYDGLMFHRVVPEFVIQGGDPKGTGTGSSDKTIKLEVTPKLKHDAAGVVAMARSSDPDSASCQFYITLAPTPFLDMKYAVFGRVTEGLDVVKKIEVGDTMKTVRIVDGKTEDVSKQTVKQLDKPLFKNKLRDQGIKITAEEERAISATLQYIDADNVPSGAISRKWGARFNNIERRLPWSASYKEYRVSPAPGTQGAGTRRIVVGSDGAIYYTNDHYGSFGRIR